VEEKVRLSIRTDRIANTVGAVLAGSQRMTSDTVTEEQPHPQEIYSLLQCLTIMTRAAFIG
jgi:hypothetical protein